jgi:hypothetical protein
MADETAAPLEGQPQVAANPETADSAPKPQAKRSWRYALAIANPQQ